MKTAGEDASFFLLNALPKHANMTHAKKINTNMIPSPLKRAFEHVRVCECFPNTSQSLRSIF